MANVLRRHFFQSVAATGLLIFCPSVALAQWLVVSKLVIEVLSGVSAIISIVPYLSKWFVDKRCNISVMELENLKFQCGLVDESLQFEDTGAIPRLTEFLERKDVDSWKRAKVALGNLLNNGSSLMSAVDDVVKKLDAKTYPGPQKDIQDLYRSIDQIRPAVAELASLPEHPNSDTIELAKSVLKVTSGLSSGVKNAIGNLQVTIADRQKLQC